METIIRKRTKKLGLVIGLFVFFAVITTAMMIYFATRASALGMPATEPLYYAGLLADSKGTPLSGIKTISIGIDLYTAETGGTKACSALAKSMTLTHGRFRIPLHKTCLTAIRDNSDLWVELKVNGDTMKPRTKIGASPYVANPEILKKNGDASFTIHSNTDTLGKSKKIFILKTGRKSPKEVFTVDNKGNVGIGDIMPPYRLSVSGSTGTRSLWLGTQTVGSNATASWSVIYNHSGFLSLASKEDMRFIVDGKTRMMVGKNGNVGIGTTSPNDKLSISDGAFRLSDSAQGSSSTFTYEKGKLTIQLDSAGKNGIAFRTYDGKYYDERVFIASKGNVGVGTTNPTEKLEVKGNILASGSINQGSSRDLKSNIRNLSEREALAAIRKLTPVRFYYNADKTEEHLGFIAEDVPELVASRDRKSIAPMDIAALLAKVVALQEHRQVIMQRQIDELKREIIELRRKR